jgi:hypothetical protein
VPAATASGSDALAFEVLGKLGGGGMGRVDLARRAGDPHGALVAVKRLHEDLAADPEFVEMFVDEARITAAIHHENVVGVIGWGSDAEGLFLATEFVRGASLRDLLRSGPLTERLAAYVCARAAAGLHAAHALGVVHRDVSPGNILVGLDGEVKIADFGIARALSSGRRTQSGVLKGKIPYMSVEQLRAEPLDGRSDLYSLGVVLFEALTGSRPWREGDDIAVLNRALTTPAPSLRSRAPSIDAELGAVVDRLLSREREARPRDGLELERELDAWLAKRGGSPAEIARVLGERVANCERGSHRRAEELEERSGTAEIVTVHTDLSVMKTRTPEPPRLRHDRRARDQLLAMLALGVVVGLVVALFVVQAAHERAAKHHVPSKPHAKELHGMIQCGPTLACDPRGSVCCEHTKRAGGGWECVTDVRGCSGEGDVPFRCSDPESCASQGRAGDFCCAHVALFAGQPCTTPVEVSCQPTCTGRAHLQVGCARGGCGKNLVCAASDCTIPGYDICVPP